MANFRLEHYKLSLDDAQNALNISSDYVKAYYRRGLAHLALRHFTEAHTDFSNLTRIIPNSQILQERLRLCTDTQYEYNLVSRLTDAQQGHVKLPDWRTIDLPKDYKGPTLEEDEEVTDTFVQKMLDYGEEFIKLHDPNDCQPCYPERLVLQILERGTAILRQEPTCVDILPTCPGSPTQTISLQSGTFGSPTRFSTQSAAHGSPVHIPFISQSPVPLSMSPIPGSPPWRQTHSENFLQHLNIAYPSPASSPPISEMFGSRTPLDTSYKIYNMQSPHQPRLKSMIGIKNQAKFNNDESSLSFSGMGQQDLGLVERKKEKREKSVTPTPSPPDDNSAESEDKSDDGSESESSETETDPDAWHSVEQRPSNTHHLTTRDTSRTSTLQHLARFDNTFLLLGNEVDIDNNPIILIAHNISLEMPDLSVGIDDRETLADVEEEMGRLESETIASDNFSFDGRSSLAASRHLSSSASLPVSSFLSMGLADTPATQRTRQTENQFGMNSVFDLADDVMREDVRCTCGMFDSQTWNEMYKRQKKKMKRQRKDEKELSALHAAMTPPLSGQHSSPPPPSPPTSEVYSLTHFSSEQATPFQSDLTTTPKLNGVIDEDVVAMPFQPLQTASQYFQPPLSNPMFVTSQPSPSNSDVSKNSLSPFAPFMGIPQPALTAPPTVSSEGQPAFEIVPLRFPTAHHSQHSDFNPSLSPDLDAGIVRMSNNETGPSSPLYLPTRHSPSPTPVLRGMPSPQRWKASLIGDLHGQFNDLLVVLKATGMPSHDHPFVFLGDYVDRGKCGVEVVMILLCLKLAHPQQVVILRGNHESADVNVTYGFVTEVKKKYNYKVYFWFAKLFSAMPLCAILNNKVFCVHGGVPPLPSFVLPELKMRNGMVWTRRGYCEADEVEDDDEVDSALSPFDQPLYYRNPDRFFAEQKRVSVDDYRKMKMSERVLRDADGEVSPRLSGQALLHEIRSIKRPSDPLSDGLTTALLWSDPSEKDGLQVSPRMAGFLFGPDMTKAFLSETGLEMVVRAHQTQMKGHSIQFRTQMSCLTLFSAPSMDEKQQGKGAWAQILFDDSEDFTMKPTNQRQEGRTEIRKKSFLVEIHEFPLRPQVKKSKVSYW